MPDEKHIFKYEALPIPSYEEATSSRTSTPAVEAPDNETANAEERRGLIANDDNEPRNPVPTRRAGYRPPLTPGYRPPTVEDAEGSDRDSLDAVDLLGHEEGRASIGSEDREVRREMEELEMDEDTQQSPWSKRMTSISRSLRLPFNIKLPNWKFRLPKWDADLFILLGRVFAIILVGFIVYFLFVSDLFTSAASRMAGQMFDPESVRIFVQEQVSADNIRSYLEHVTSYDHIAGTEGDYALGQWVEGMFATAGLEQVWTDEYEVYLNYPRADGRAVEILNVDGTVAWSAKIDEEKVYPDREQTLAFHGHSKSGDVKGPLIYANYGSREDFKTLHDSGIETTGAIALVRYYGSEGDRALKIKAAEEAGFIGCLIYSDPAEDGFVLGPAYPDGRYMPSDGVQRGGVSLMSWAVGDVLTPGWPSKKGQLRLQPGDAKGLNKIPSLPLAWRDAQPLLQAIKGYGEAVSDGWKGGVPDTEWWSGNLSSPIVRLKNEQDEEVYQPIWNVMGRIRGVEQKEKRIIVGNHRDAWAFGAVDPGSGTAVLLEIVRIFGMLVDRGWRPLRTIEFASWDGEEYNLIGSTEYVEDNMKMLRSDGYAYLNVDVAVAGEEFHAAASPVFGKSLLHALDRTTDPTTNETMRKTWDDRQGRLEGLGAGSDYVAFQDLAGVSSFDMGFQGKPFPYHSVYDNFEWMEKFGDPGFEKHKVLGQIWALLILEMADKPVLPFDIEAYSSSITHWTQELQNWADGQGAHGEKGAGFSMEPLTQAVLELARNVQEWAKWENTWMSNVYATGGFEGAAWGSQRLHRNNLMSGFEKALLDLEDGGGVSYLECRMLQNH